MRQRRIILLQDTKDITKREIGWLAAIAYSRGVNSAISFMSLKHQLEVLPQDHPRQFSYSLDSVPLKRVFRALLEVARPAGEYEVVDVVRTSN